jgi:hypothetical protein
MRKIYFKRSGLSSYERQLVTEITAALNNGANADLTDFPATSLAELKAAHEKYCSDQFDSFEEVKEENPSPNRKTTMQTDPTELSGKTNSPQPAAEAPKTFLDPFNDAEPIVRDYVLSDGFKSAEDEQQPQQADFAEPTSFEESFELPADSEEKSPSGKSKEREKEKEKKEPEKPLNPNFDDMSAGKKRRSTKKLAEMLISGVCLLAERGCIWWTTKDITEEKLVTYELENTIDLQILLTLDEGQQITVREWFRAKAAQSQTLFKVDPEDKEDLIDQLTVVLLEKGIAPTPMQELMISAVKTFVLNLGMRAFLMQQEIKSVITQLKTMQQEGIAARAEVPTIDDIDTEVDENPYIEDAAEPVSPIDEPTIE